MRDTILEKKHDLGKNEWLVLVSKHLSNKALILNSVHVVRNLNLNLWHICNDIMETKTKQQLLEEEEEDMGPRITPAFLKNLRVSLVQKTRCIP